MEYIDAAKVAGLLRSALKESFPGTKFSVRTKKYAGGASIDVDWVDGPSRAAVERVCGVFEGSYFDGMIDYKGCIYHKLDGQVVRFHADFIFENRKLSPEAEEIGAAAVKAHYQSDVEPILYEERNAGSRWAYMAAVVNPGFPGAIEGRFRGEHELIGPDGMRACRVEPLEAWYDAAEPFATGFSPTLARISIAGSDGYGDTSIPPLDGGEGARGYPRHESVQVAA